MIRTVADLLREIRDAELPALDHAPVTHTGTIGDMYEGLSGTLLQRALPGGASLMVVTGIISDGHSYQSGQIDRMLVVGEGTRLPHTDSYIWHVKDVVAVLEVKKRLDTSRLPEAFDQLAKVRTVAYKWLNSPEFSLEASRYRHDVFAKTFSQFTGNAIPPHEQFDRLDVTFKLMHATLQMEQLLPLRIILGYHGWKTEAGLRRATVKFINSRLAQGGITPGSMPQLIACGDFSLVKVNGHPYINRLRNGQWDFYVSMSGNPWRVLLELVWTRLDEMFGFENPWGEDLELEIGKSFLSATPIDDNGRPGWIFDFNDVPEKRLASVRDHIDWSPAALTEKEFDLLVSLLNGEEVLLTAVCSTEGESWSPTLPRPLATLQEAQLVAVDGQRLILTCPSIKAAEMPDGSFVAADNITGRLDRWIAQNLNGN